jgi:hypothetical protein
MSRIVNNVTTDTFSNQTEWNLVDGIIMSIDDKTTTVEQVNVENTINMRT